MDKVKYISIIIIAIASVVVTILVANVLLDTTGKVIKVILELVMLLLNQVLH